MNAESKGRSASVPKAVSASRIEDRILEIRGQRVMLDSDLADFYGVATKRLNEQVRRNLARFPDDFLFQLTPEEKSEVVASCDHLNKVKYSNRLPWAFTEHGVIMAANVLRSERAAKMSVFVVRAFVNLRQGIEANRALANRLEKLEKRLVDHDGQLVTIVRAIRSLVETSPKSPKRRIGFSQEKSD